MDSEQMKTDDRKAIYERPWDSYWSDVTTERHGPFWDSLPEQASERDLREFKDSVSGDKPDDVVDPTRPVTLDRLPASDESNPFDRVEGVNAPAKPASNGTAPVA